MADEDAKKAEELEKRINEAEKAERFDEAILLSEELLALRTNLQGADHWEVIDQRVNLDFVRKVAAMSPDQRIALYKTRETATEAKQLENKGQYSAAESLRQNLVNVRRELLGERHPLIATSYDNLATNLNSQGKYADAQSLHERALNLYRELLGESHPDTATGLSNLASNLCYQGKYADAQPIFQQALEIKRNSFGERHQAVASGYGNLAATLSAQAKYAAAHPLYEKALNLHRELLGDRHLDTAQSYDALAANLDAQGRYTEAEPLHKRALDLTRELLGERHPTTATTYRFLAFNLNSQGKYRDAQNLFENALNLHRELLGERHPVTVGSLNTLAKNLFSQAKYAEALPLFRRVLDLNRELLGDEHPYTVASYNNLAKTLDGQYKHAEAEPLFKKALDLSIKTHGERHPDTATYYANLATTMDYQGRHAEAQPFFEKGLELTRDVLGERHLDMVTRYNNLAGNLRQQGKYDDAQRLLQKALELNRDLLGDKHPDTATAYNNLAVNLDSQNRHTDAQPLFELSLELRRELLGERHPVTADTYYNLASASCAQGKHTDAVLFLLKAASAYESARLQFAQQGLERAVLGLDHSPYRLLTAVHARLGATTEAWDAAQLNLARGLNDEIAQRRNLNWTPEESRRRAELIRRLDELQPQMVALLSKQSPNEVERHELEMLKTERKALEANLSELAVTLSRREVTTLAQVQSALPADAALLMWVDYSDTSGSVQEHWGCVVRDSGEPHWAQLPGSGPNQTWIVDDGELPHQFRTALRTATTSEEEIAPLAALLRDQRLAPLVRHLVGVKTLYVIADDEMAGIPVEVLTQDYTVSYLPSATFLARSQNQPPIHGTTLLVLADPVFASPHDRPRSSTEPPPSGVLVMQVAPGGAAAKAGLRTGDVILRYGDTDVASVDQFSAAVQAQATAQEIPLSVWRDGTTEPIRCVVPPGRLGVMLSKEPIRDAILRRRESDALVRGKSSDSWEELPGSRAELAQLTTLFGDNATALVDSSASEQRLDELRESGELGQYRYLHLATHGETSDVRSFDSSLILAQDTLPELPLPRAGKPLLDGRLAASEVLDYWTLNAELVTLSACETALGRRGGGDGLLGFAQAFITSGSRAVCLSLWNVDDTATALLMARFYQNMLGKRAGLDRPLPKSEALAEAKRWLRELPADEALRLTAAATNGVVRGSRGKGATLNPVLPTATTPSPASRVSKPFTHPRFWSAFILIGDPR